MEKINLIVVENDEMYLNAFKNYIINNYSGRFNIICYTDISILNENINKMKNKDVLLIDEELFEQINDLSTIKTVLILTNGNFEECEGYKTINKFQAISNICEEIINSFNSISREHKKIEKIVKKGDAKTRIITVYSPVGGSGKTSVATTLSVCLAERNMKVLYLNFEDIQSTSTYFNENKLKSFSELIYYIKEENENFREKFFEIVNVDNDTGVNFLESTDNILDIEDINQNDIKWFIEKILEFKYFDYVIIDTSSKFNSVYKMIMDCSEMIICPFLYEETSIKKLEIFLSNIDFIDKIVFLLNKINPNINNIDFPECLEKAEKEIRKIIELDESMIYSLETNCLNSNIIKSKISQLIDELDF
ncbi:MAG: AAA family ATPase [Clostridium sp.]|nr:AAA family ATPase [Clostridium sp.]